MKKFQILFFFLISLGLGAQTPAEVVDNYLEAIGGKTALKNIKSLQAEIRVESNGIVMDGRLAYSIPGKQYTEMTFRDDKIVEVINGDQGWMINPMTGSSTPIPMTAEQVRAAKKNITAEKLLNTADYTLEDLGEKVLKGNTYRVLNVKFKQGDEPARKQYFNKSTGLIEFTEVASPMGGTIFVAFEDYKDVNGLKFPASILSYTDSDLDSPAMSLTMKNLQVNAPVDNTLFSKPQ
ncbi:hypothetical protein E7Z59_14275 [Robertkochia marina]|uniref:Outer membrane lipoprotein carrier protein LolA n=1 Tax=Robertkochia marina TaxID=1227945 RepID=A0A4V3UXV3_9FLAO|nr:hypothetical protein [Robertkochia marina]THD65750.1 hypothetical protein E7Z59_14275 [Robertkochia marina]TRZ46565.1 hypothetical protein D3A96_03075 [Robertkochia marina]